MENATKALLIAAAVLIAIVLIALGVKLLGSAKDTSTEANAVGEKIETQTEVYKGQATEALDALTQTEATEATEEKK